ncbi:hypothetical protein KKC44_04295 [Patescibacteria group bacterium]|nr:hypothetical protein [Patescibacteria group bacterium]MBU2259798.1 hypothetical protein [Patescibacteria group bacterium]
MFNWIEAHPLATTVVGGVIVIFIGYLAKRFMGGRKMSNSQECKIELSPSIREIPPVMNGGKLQGEYANFQIRFRSKSDLELKEATLICGEKIIPCKDRDSKLRQIDDNFLFEANKIPFVPDEILYLKIQVCDHNGNCCELTHELQMKQFPRPDYEGKISGRWEIHPKGIFKVKCAD